MKSFLWIVAIMGMCSLCSCSSDISNYNKEKFEENPKPNFTEIISNTDNHLGDMTQNTINHEKYLSQDPINLLENDKYLSLNNMKLIQSEKHFEIYLRLSISSL